MDQQVHDLVRFIAEHSAWTGPIIFLVTFGESFDFVSLLFPGTAIIIAAGALIPTGAVPVAPLLIGGIAGAALGDGISYWIGRRFDDAIPKLWPFTTRPELLERGRAFFRRHGGKSIFIGRFFGPVRAVIPLIAGMMDMEPRRFWLMNVLSAMVWAPLLLVPGLITTSALETANAEGAWGVYVLAICIFAFAGWILWKIARR
jgi:undecaprenyl-diphosphatase